MFMIGRVVTSFSTYLMLLFNDSIDNGTFIFIGIIFIPAIILSFIFPKDIEGKFFDKSFSLDT